MSRPKGSHPIRKNEFNEEFTSAKDCQDLWAAKVMAYLHDALQPYKRGVNLSPKVARGWFGTYDFKMTCHCAGLEHEAVMNAFKDRLALAESGDYAAALNGIAQPGRTPE